MGDGEQAPSWSELQWTPELVRIFWDWQATRSGSAYFSRQMAVPLTVMVRCLVPSGGAVLDLGCGPGHLAEPLLAAGRSYVGADQSPVSLDSLARRMHDRPGFLGTAAVRHGRVAWRDGAFSAILLLETLEHLTEEEAGVVLSECRRLLGPGGLLLVTVPHAEDLEAAKVFCPVSRMAFHPWQHRRSFSAAKLAAGIEQQGFATFFCAAGDLGKLTHAPLRNPLNWSVNYLRTRLRLAVLERCAAPGPRPAGWLRAVFHGAGPNLFWTGRVR